MAADEVVEAVSAAIGQPILLEATIDDRFKTTTGSFAITPKFVVIVFRGIDPHAYQMHSLFHELGHLLCGHQLCERPGTPLDASPMKQLLWNDAEREAEFLAYKITALISRKPPSSQAFG
jgi:Zn-dependent peptidase ImmA (M78 family)